VLTLQQIIERNKSLRNTQSGLTDYKVLVISNITVNQLAAPLEYYLRQCEINPQISIGDYDSIINDSKKSSKYDLVIIFWETSNIIEGLHFKADYLLDEDLLNVGDKVKLEIKMVLDHLKESSLVIWNKFSSLLFTTNTIKKNKFESFVDELNLFLENNIGDQIHLTDIDKVISSLGLKNSYDPKFYHLFKSLYKPSFFLEYSSYIMPVIKSSTGKVKKVLILDCDNTLWNGIIGEDGIEGINLSYNNKKGSPFFEAQTIFKTLNDQGCLICLCSKNNFNDVEVVFKEHPDMVLNWDNTTLRKINWNNKVDNIRDLSTELNLGLDSFVFIDDSDFEVNMVKEQLQMVEVIQVPKNNFEYPDLLRKYLIPMFYSKSTTEEDLKKVEQYAIEIERNKTQKISTNFDDYIESLKLEVTLYIDNKDHIGRISQMTQKTNQFNFSTKRYTEKDIQKLINSREYKIFTFSVKDKFGDYGLTGLYIFQLEQSKCIIDTFLMSCRVIGRKVELAVFEKIVEYFKKNKIISFELDYIKTNKNILVENLADELGFESTESSKSQKKYLMLLQNFSKLNTESIKTTLSIEETLL